MNIQTPESRLRFREAVGLEIDRLISLLDIEDGDENLEPFLADTYDEREGAEDDSAPGLAEGDERADDEPMLGAPEKHQPAFTSWGSVRCPAVSQAHWADGTNTANADDFEVENEHGGDIQDEPHDDAAHFGGTDHEPDLGWTNHIDQTKASKVKAGNHVQDGEPDYGFVGIGTGWRFGEETDDREGCNELDDDKSDYEYDLGWSNPRFGDEAFVTPAGWAHTDVPCTGEGGTYDGSGETLARQMLREGGGTYRPEPLIKALREAHRELASYSDLIPEIEPGSLVLRIHRQ